MDRQWLLAFTATWVLVVGCALAVPAAPTPTNLPTETHSPTAEPTATPTATAAPQSRLEAADQALFVGDWEQARQHFQAVIDSGPDSDQAGSAHLGIATSYWRAGDATTAESDLGQFISQFPDHPQAANAYFLRGQARLALGALDGALSDFVAYQAGSDDTLDSHVHEQLGDLLRQLDRPQEAVGRYDSAMAAPHLGSNLTLQVKAGLALFEAEDYVGALGRFQSVHDTAEDGVTKATANLLLGRTYEMLDDLESAHARYLESFNNWPAAIDSYNGLVRLVEAGVPVDDYQRGLVDYYAGAYEPALNAFNRAESGNPSANLYYFRGLTLRALGDGVSARLDFQFLINNYPDSARWLDAWLEKARTEWLYLDLAEDAILTYESLAQVSPDPGASALALYEAGRIAERQGELGRAGDLWLRIPNEFGGRELAHAGAFEAGIVRMREGRYGEAIAHFELAQATTGNSERASAARLWRGKALAASGDSAGARSDWQQAAALDPTGFYSLRAADLLIDRPPFEPVGVFQLPSSLEGDRQAAEVWLRQTFVIEGPEPLTALDTPLAQDPRRLRGDAYWQLGMFEQSKLEFESLRAEVAGDAEATYRLMHHMLDLGLYQPAIFAARNILDLAGLDDAGTLRAPAYFNYVRFGAYFGELILPEAQAYGMDPLLLLAVTRQESLFEGFATSYAAARGLMQVIPPTGAEIAGQLGWPPDYTEDDLYRPIVSVRFGAYYLARQRDLFEGDLVAALAAYNAGPGNSLAWRSLAPTDPDLFVEVVRIEQPQEYIRSIYEVYRIYQSLYVSE